MQVVRLVRLVRWCTCALMHLFADALVQLVRLVRLGQLVHW